MFVCPLPGGESPRHALFQCLLQPNLSPSYMTHFTSHRLQKSPLPCLLNHVSLSGFAFGSLGFDCGGCSEVVEEVSMYVHADLYLPYVQEQETSCLLFCLSLIHFFLLLIPRSLFIAKTQAYFFNTLPDVCGPPESANCKCQNPGENIMSCVHFTQPFPKGNKQINKLDMFTKMHEMHCGDC